MCPLIIHSGNATNQIGRRQAQLGIIQGPAPPGCLKRRVPYGAISAVPPAEEIIDVIPRELWPELVTKQHGNFLHDHTRSVLPPHDQGQTNYCWCHGSVRTVEALRIFDGQPPRILSAESVGVPITGGRNRGGYPEEALRQLIDYGACLQEYWPNNDLDERHAVTGWKTNRLGHRIIRWVDVEGFDMQFTLALNRIPAAIGLGWWGHLICQLDPIYYDEGHWPINDPTIDDDTKHACLSASSPFGLGCDNSWGPDYGDNGYFLLTEDKATADLGAFAPLSDSWFEQ